MNEKRINYAVTSEVHPNLLNGILKLIPKHFKLVQTQSKNADYVFHSANNWEVLNYSGIRIFVTGENVSPDFNLSDYALGFDPISFQDRYIQLPLIKLYSDAYAVFTQARPNSESISSQKSGFCAYVMSNTKNSALERISLFEQINNYKPVASGGKWNNTVGGPVADKIAFQSKYKFVLALENASHPGYLTEKFAQAAQSNAVPIYWGDPSISSIFNPKAFINCHAFPSIESIVKEIIAIDQNASRYKQMLSQPWFKNNQEPEHLKDSAYAHFFDHLFLQEKEQAYRRNRSRWGKKYERSLKKIHKRFF